MCIQLKHLQNDIQIGVSDSDIHELMLIHVYLSKICLDEDKMALYFREKYLFFITDSNTKYCTFRAYFTKSNYLNKDETANRPLISLVSYRSQFAFNHFKALIMAKRKNGFFVNRFEAATRGSYT